MLTTQDKDFYIESINTLCMMGTKSFSHVFVFQKNSR
jgi:hypothetical protein